MSEINLPENFSGIHFHFVGIKGTGMVALVEILNARGAVITGSDVSERFYTDEILEKCRDCPFLPDCTGFRSCPNHEANCREHRKMILEHQFRLKMERQ